MTAIPTTAAERLPVIDFAAYRFGDQAARRKVSSDVAEACSAYGFFYLTDHGVAKETIRAGFDAAAAFFALPLEQRLACRSPEKKQNRGYQPLLETHKIGFAPDIKESFDMGFPFPADDPDVQAGLPFHGLNRWPDLPGFRVAVEALYFAMFEAGRDVLRAMAESLALDRNFFAGRCRRPSTNMRLVHYPAQPPVSSDSGIGAAAHTDRGIVTLLLNDDNGGLQVESADGRWIEAPPLADGLIVNVGDLMTHWTNGRFRSAMHRVINASGRERISIPQFHHPDFRTIVDPRDVEPGAKSYFGAVVAGEAVASKFKSERKSWQSVVTA